MLAAVGAFYWQAGVPVTCCDSTSKEGLHHQLCASTHLEERDPWFQATGKASEDVPWASVQGWLGTSKRSLRLTQEWKNASSAHGGPMGREICRPGGGDLRCH